MERKRETIDSLCLPTCVYNVLKKQNLIFIDVLDAIILKKDVSFEDMILHHDEGVDLIPGNIRLADIDRW